jgi:hypothetical protein
MRADRGDEKGGNLWVDEGSASGELDWVEGDTKGVG